MISININKEYNNGDAKISLSGATSFQKICTKDKCYFSFYILTLISNSSFMLSVNVKAKVTNPLI
jgi:hypothetical protein